MFSIKPQRLIIVLLWAGLAIAQGKVNFIIPDTLYILPGEDTVIQAHGLNLPQWTSTGPFTQIDANSISVNPSKTTTYEVISNIEEKISNENPDFETPIINARSFKIIHQDQIPGWKTLASDKRIEIWSTGFSNVTSYSGNQFIELNANEVGELYQDLETVPGSKIAITFAHRGRGQVDEMGLKAGPVNGPYTTLGSYSDGPSKWGIYQEFYTVPPGQGKTRILFTSEGYSSRGVGNFLDDVRYTVVREQRDSVVVVVMDANWSSAQQASSESQGETSLFFTDKDNNIIDQIESKHQEISIVLETTKQPNYGERVRVTLPGFDSMVVTLDNIGQNQNSTRYQKTLSLEWNYRYAYFNNLYGITPGDEIEAIWMGPDTLKANISSFWEGPTAKFASLLDSNQDGRLDYIEFEFNQAIDSWFADKIQVDFTWALEGYSAPQKGSLSDFGVFAKHPSSDEKVFWIPDDNWNPVIETGIPKQYSNWTFTYIDHPGIKHQPRDLLLVDKMRPMATEGLLNFGKNDQSQIQLIVSFSENIKIKDSYNNPAMAFKVFGDMPSGTSYPSYGWLEEGRKMVIPFDSSSTFFVELGDSLKLLPDLGNFHDLSENYSSQTHPFVPITGDLPMHLQVNGYVELSPEQLLDNNSSNSERTSRADSSFAISWIGGKQEAMDFFQVRNQIGVSVGPIKLDPSDSASSAEFKYQIQVSDLTGQAVTTQTGSVNCPKANDFETADCFSQEGAKVLFAWNHKSTTGRLVGIGIYLIQIKFDRDEEIFKVGIGR